MAKESVWPAIHEERQALADDLAGLDDARWNTPSLCEPWTVQEVLAHMTATAQMTPPKFFAKFAAARFRFHDMSAREVAAHASGTPQETLAEFRAHIGDSTSPPGPADSWLGETIVHAEDIRRPLGISHTYPVTALVRVADFYKGSNMLIGAKNRIAGMTLRATDTDWSTGSGVEVTGPMLSLVMVLTGRAAAVADLAGEGTALLASRMSS